jgi:hypothetical protein
MSGDHKFGQSRELAYCEAKCSSLLANQCIQRNSQIDRALRGSDAAEREATEEASF